jgi:hypothetical protein
MSNRIRYILFLTLVTPLCLELALRLLGNTPFLQIQYSIVSKPNMCLKASSNLGFALGEGVYNVSMNGAPTYTATHLNGKRITRTDTANDSLLDVFIMGCSYTYGMGVTDTLSFPYLLQSHFNQLDIQNFGVPGYGSVQSYLQLKKEVDSGNIPDLVIVNFCDFHHIRNSLTPEYRNSLVLGYNRSNKEVASELSKSKFPYIENGQIKLVQYDNLYSNWVGRETFSAVNYFQTISDDNVTLKIDIEQNSLEIFLWMQEICIQNNIQFAVAGLTKNKKTFSFIDRLNKSDIHAIDITLDLRRKKFNQMPHDSHPNAKAHDAYAKKIIPKIEEWINSLSPAS